MIVNKCLFIGRVKFICPKIKACGYLGEVFMNSIHYGVDIGWADLGTWGSLFDIAPKKDENNNAVLKTRAMLYECEDNIIALGNNKRLAVIQGLKNYIVAESGNVLLICKKEDEDRIKQYMADTRLKYDNEFS